MEPKETGSSAPLNAYNRLTETPHIPAEKKTFQGRKFTPLANKENAKAVIQEFAEKGKTEIETFKRRSNEWEAQANVIQELKDKLKKEELDEAPGKLTAAQKNLIRQLKLEQKNALISSEGFLRSSQDLPELPGFSHDETKARVNELEATSIQKSRQKKTEVIKSSIRTLALVDTDIQKLDSQIKELRTTQDKTHLVHVEANSEISSLQETLSQTGQKLLDNLTQQRNFLIGLKDKIMKDTKEPNLKPAKEQEFIYNNAKDGIKTALAEAKRFQDNINELPTWSTFRPLNLFLSLFQKPVVINDESSPYSETIVDIKKQIQSLETRLGAKKTLEEELLQAQFNSDFANYQNVKASLLANILKAKEVKFAGILFPTPPVIGSWSKEAKFKFNNLVELYETEKSYLSSLLKLEEKLKNQPKEDLKFSDSHHANLRFIQGLIAGSRLFLNQAESFFGDKVLSENNLQANLDSFFDQVNASEDFQNYMKLYESAQFMYNMLNNNLETAVEKEKMPGVASDNKYQFLSIQFIQRGPRYRMQLDNIYKESHHPIQDTIVKTFQITNLNENLFSSVADYQNAAEEIRNDLAK